MNEELVELRYRPDDPFCHPIHGKPVKLAALVCRRRPTSKSGYEIMGRISHALRFREMADHYYALPAQDSLMRLLDAMRRGDVPAMDALGNFKNGSQMPASNFVFRGDCGLPPPPLFSRVQCPLNYGYEQLAMVEKLVGPDGNVVFRNKSVKALRDVASYTFDDDIPTGPAPGGLCDRFVGSVANQGICDVLDELFRVRPIWTRQALTMVMRERGLVNTAFINHFIQYMLMRAFYYCGGPWRACWVRYGYDPRSEANREEAKLLQIVHFRCSRSTLDPHSKKWVTISILFPLSYPVNLVDTDHI
jgi:general transcription factor 3C polypeptide 5 (transcription factor C subunit 1)